MVTAFQLSKRIDSVLMDNIKVLYNLEYNNFNYSHDKNVQYFKENASVLSPEDLYEVIIAFNALIVYFLSDEAILILFMNKLNGFCNKILSEMFSKREYCINKMKEYYD